MTQLGTTHRWQRSLWFAVMTVAAGLAVAMIVAACEIPTHAGEFATEVPDATMTITTTQCGTGQVFCAVDGGANVCTDTQTDIDNCGACGNACDPSFVCSSGTCTCPSNKKSCSGACVDVTQDSQNCGKCDAACGNDQVCITNTLTEDKPTCLAFCLQGETNCPVGCFNLQTNSNHCGSCDRPCPGGSSCASGECQDGCAKDQTLCESSTGVSTCTDLTNDDSNCGSCNHACVFGSSCVGPECLCTTPGEVVCTLTDKTTMCVPQGPTRCGPGCQSCRAPSGADSGAGTYDAAIPGICSANGFCIYDAGGIPLQGVLP